jgi:hypothetical protein
MPKDENDKKNQGLHSRNGIRSSRRVSSFSSFQGLIGTQFSGCRLDSSMPADVKNLGWISVQL